MYSRYQTHPSPERRKVLPTPEEAGTILPIDGVSFKASPQVYASEANTLE